MPLLKATEHACQEITFLQKIILKNKEAYKKILEELFVKDKCNENNIFSAVSDSKYCHNILRTMMQKNHPYFTNSEKKDRFNCEMKVIANFVYPYKILEKNEFYLEEENKSYYSFSNDKDTKKLIKDLGSILIRYFGDQQMYNENSKIIFARLAKYRYVYDYKKEFYIKF
ncbi:hypothetical protein C2G38_2267778 [Gigaspora rosea]|uniref:Uncharacterized protein n=1 Tax=Gigaspora rosea TaxID=44941 RepID=A0A397VYK1_9GLOM|nr:hypothetical protein C2G38_2267778 [Gigaspora rosea]